MRETKKRFIFGVQSRSGGSSVVASTSIPIESHKLSRINTPLTSLATCHSPLVTHDATQAKRFCFLVALTYRA